MTTIFNKLFHDELESMEADGHKVNSVWDIAIRLLSKNSEAFLVTLKADLNVITLIANGYSAFAISNKLGIPSIDVYAVAKLWGFQVLDKSLDLNPYSIYVPNMSPAVFETVYNSFVPVQIHIQDAEKVINNIEHFEDILYCLKEYEKDEESNITRF